MYVTDSLNSLINLFLQYYSQGRADTYNMRYADLVDRTPKPKKKQETEQEIISRLTNKIKGGK